MQEYVKQTSTKRKQSVQLAEEVIFVFDTKSTFFVDYFHSGATIVVKCGTNRKIFI